MLNSHWCFLPPQFLFSIRSSCDELPTTFPSTASSKISNVGNNISYKSKGWYNNGVILYVLALLTRMETLDAVQTRKSPSCLDATCNCNYMTDTDSSSRMRSQGLGLEPISLSGSFRSSFFNKVSYRRQSCEFLAVPLAKSFDPWKGTARNPQDWWRKDLLLDLPGMFWRLRESSLQVSFSRSSMPWMAHQPTQATTTTFPSHYRYGQDWWGSIWVDRLHLCSLSLHRQCQQPYQLCKARSRLCICKINLTYCFDIE